MKKERLSRFRGREREAELVAAKVRRQRLCTMRKIGESQSYLPK